MHGLLSWYRRSARDLPWRRTTDPWAIWVSEIMLQQTRVDTVGSYWERFLARFPNAEALAAADEQEVLSHWAGLGYYRRARHLHQAAQEVTERHGGRVPADPVAFRALPGVGRYTAGAVMSIAFGAREPIVDGNVIRVLARRFALRGDPRSTEFTRRVWELAEQLLPDEDVGDFNQALMELGATVCKPVAPACDRCPLEPRCVAAAGALQDELPEVAKRGPVRAISAVGAVLERDGCWLLARRPDGGLLAGLWEFPAVELPAGRRPSATALAAGLPVQLDIALERRALERLGVVEHLFTHRRLRLTVYRARRWTGTLEPRAYPELRFVPPDAPDVPLPRLTRKVMELIAG